MITYSIAHYFGLTNAGGEWYLFWSGFGSIIISISLLGSIGGMIWKKLNCHEDSCRRIGIHHVEGTPFVVCKEHHPHLDNDKPITSEHIAKASAKHAHRIHL